MIKIVPATTQKKFNTLALLAQTIWCEYYIPMVGKPQVDYMLEKHQSVEAIKKQVCTGFEYCLITFDEIPVSYIAFKRDENYLFLSKIYVLEAYRGKKIGKKAMQFIEEKCKSYHLKSIRLYVNINNANAIATYKKLGFVKVGVLKAAIGSGFYTDDFVMEKVI